MKTHKCLALICLSLFAPSLFGQANAPARDQFQQLTAQLQNSPNDEALREKIINLARMMAPPPVLPEEAGRRMARGFAAFKEAKSVADYKDAVTEFEKATLAAPWYADAYYNLGQARAKAEDFAGAAASLKLYLLAAPEAKDAADAKTLMYEMEYKQEKADKERSAAQAQAQQAAQKQRLLEAFRGNWDADECWVGKISRASLSRGCTGAEMQQSNWYSHGQRLQLEIESDGTVKLGGFLGCIGSAFGIPQGPSLRDIRWEIREEGRPPRQTWGSMSATGNQFTVSCNRSPSATDAAPYIYIMWTRTP
ncbi:MAG: hypothetical protein LAN59_08280 [Acidobacteriia bacterium]|nr:hypothetical protein [Terriglobia bacterium]